MQNTIGRCPTKEAKCQRNKTRQIGYGIEANTQIPGTRTYNDMLSNTSTCTPNGCAQTNKRISVQAKSYRNNRNCEWNGQWVRLGGWAAGVRNIKRQKFN